MAKVQTNREIGIGTPLGDDVLVLTSMSGTEQLGRLFQYELELASDDHEVKFQDIVGHNVTVRIQHGAGEPRFFNGFVSRFVQMPDSGGMARYHATVVPWLWFLTRTADCRIFQEMTVPDIIKQVFRDHGFTDFQDALSGEYRTWENCVQYRETDFNFISRLMEQEGIYYFFEHKDGEHVLVLADSLSSHQPYPAYETIAFHPPDSTSSATEVITSLVTEQQVMPGGYALTDFDFKNPKSALEARASIPREHAVPDFEIFDYPGEYCEFDHGEKYARIRIEELQSQFEIVRGESDARGLAAGYTFELTDYPRADQNREYLVTAVHHQIRSDEFDSHGAGGNGTGASEGGKIYACTLTAIDAREVYRPKRVTPKPVVQGPQTAMVVGQDGEEIYTDEYGRVKVQFHWDRYGKADENSSCWVRVAQIAAGKQWGAMFLPRIGQEVIVEFLEGDPDHPIITGRVYHGDAMPPYELPAHKTISTIKTNSSKDGGGFNEIRFEDEKGEEQIFIHAEKNLDRRIKNNAYELVGNDQHEIVENDRFEHIKNNRNVLVDASHKEKIGEDHNLNVGGKKAVEIGDSFSLTVGGNVIEVFQGDHSEETSGDLYVKGSNVVIEGTSGLTLKCGSSCVVIDSSGVTVKGSSVTIDGSMAKINSGPGSSAGSGSAGSAVAPADPDEAEEADTAEPGEIAEIKAEQRERQEGKYGKVVVPAFKPPEEEEVETTWIEIELIDNDDNPVPGEPYRIETADGRVITGTLDENGYARREGIEPGTCKVTFPRLDQDAWEPA